MDGTGSPTSTSVETRWRKCTWTASGKATCAAPLYGIATPPSGLTLLPQHGGSLPTAQLLADIKVNNWSTVPLLFDGADNCTVAGNMGKAPSFIHFDGRIETSCMSQFELCIGFEPDCTVAVTNGKCLFPQAWRTLTEVVIN